MMTLLRTILAWLMWLLWGKSTAKPIVPDPIKVQSTPDTTTHVVSDAIGTNANIPRSYLTPAVVSLLTYIRQGESGRGGYNADFGNNQTWDLVHATFDQVRAWSLSQVTSYHELSSAIGAYQFITPTLDSLKQSLKLTGREIFDVAFQDDLAYALMVRRGINSYYGGTLTAEGFCNNLAKEWASLPVVTTIQGAHRLVTPGQSYYAGDGINKSGHSPSSFLQLVKDLKK
ncbi:MAG: hypothetical protein KGL39_36520 [Patescibacteria group bacterium]|nr:hypothetical protein [Patescibacteria group bacterium]